MDGTAIKVRTREASRLFNNLTHESKAIVDGQLVPNPSGASRMTVKKDKIHLKPEMNLLLDVLHDEYAAQIFLYTQPVSAVWLDEEKTVERPRRILTEIENVFIPPPTPELTTEFNILFKKFERVTGPVTQVIFQDLMFTRVKAKTSYAQIRYVDSASAATGTDGRGPQEKSKRRVPSGFERYQPTERPRSVRGDGHKRQKAEAC